MTRKLVVSVYISLDGVVQDPVGMENSGLGNWVGPFSRGPEGDEIMRQELWAADLALMGRTTYEGFAAVWPNLNDPGGFAKRLNGMPKYVASTTMRQAEWTNTTVLSVDVAGHVRRLKGEGEGDILVYGSAGLVHSLLPLGLVDQVHMLIYPTVLGRGTRLFPNDFAARFDLRDLRQLGSGMAHAVYTPS
ncbi:MAG TPA: dihydrofolate reductase family protein [Devosia sp.]|jgi:dihydrofolate reductase|uniref:dihydrofolate reductase family protein n=1 Tax=Devosia sp. TaxID=1871048 RepID=UPI002DDD36A5|nr:dihydrofolate reductase family protein [Devosia sp.]HEV2517081.1 dihydrofolate reductase family protein [Devosia sp.]